VYKWFYKDIYEMEEVHPSFTQLSDKEPQTNQVEKPGHQTFTVAVEGNIGSGKTTMLNYFAKFPEIEVVCEPVDRWRDCKGHNILGLLYEDSARWGLLFQSYVQLTMMKNHLQPVSAPVKLLERSIYSGRYCFVENLQRSGKLRAAELLLLDEWFDWIVSSQPVAVDHIVYLRSSPEVVHERIRLRSRSEEAVIPLSYLQELHERHEDWLVNKSSGFPVPAPVLVLDANQDLQSIHKAYSQFTDRLIHRS